MQTDQKAWPAPPHVALPDFIICGAMKSGTTSLHQMLNLHPNVFIPNKEVHFFDADNIMQHPDFNQFTKLNQGTWHYPNVMEQPEKYWQWYKEQFHLATKGQLIGEDSTTYLASDIALQRIAKQTKKIKIVVMLRQPTARTYSHYWHMVKAGKALYSFEDTLRYLPHSLLDRSAYLKQLKSLYTHFPKEQVKVILFEDFIANKLATLNELCNFLNIDINGLPKQAFNLHANAARVPKFLMADLIKNRLFRGGANQASENHFQIDEQSKTLYRFTVSKAFNKIYRLLNPLINRKAPPISAASQAFLDRYFYQELQGIDELIGQEIMSKWFN